MHIRYARCGGLDVHKRMIAACILLRGPLGEAQQEIRRCGTMTRDLLELVDWLQSQQVTHVAMESTGVYWKPIWNILEGQVAVILVNAPHSKAVPGRKTDTTECRGVRSGCNTGYCAAALSPPPRSGSCGI